MQMQKYIFLIFCFFQAVNTFGQESVDLFPVVGEDITNLRVTCMLQDSNGFMWFGSASGLYRYDGNKLVHYADSAAGLFHQSVLFLFEDNKGNLWISENENRLISYSLKRGEFHLFNFKGDIGTFTAFCVDKHGYLWAGTNKGNLYFLKNNTFVHDSTSLLMQTLVHSGRINSLTCRPGGQIWAGTSQGGVFVFHPLEKNNFRQILDKMTITCLYSNNPGVNVWITTPKGVYLYEPIENNTEVSLQIKAEDAGFHTITSSPDRGIYVFGNKTNHCYKFQQDNMISVALSGEGKILGELQTAMYDRNGLLWIIAANRLFIGTNKRFSANKLRKPGINKPVGRNIMGIVQESDSLLWMAAWESGVFLAEEDGTVLRSFNNLPTKKIWTLARAGKNKLWIGTWNMGAFLLDTRSGDYIKLDESKGLTTNNVKCFLVEDSITWIGLWNETPDPASIFRYNMLTGSLNAIQLSNYTGIDPFINCFYRDSRENLWVGTVSGGLLRLIKDDDAFYVQKYNHSAGKIGSLSNNHVTCLYEDKARNLWVGTENGGLNKYLYEKDNFQHVPLGRRGKGGMVRSILEDSNGRLWIAGNGLTTVDTTGNIKALFSSYDGLQEKAFNHFSALVNHRQQLVFGGGEGFHVFHPESTLSSLARNYSVFITGLAVNGKQVELGKRDISGHVLLPEPLHVKKKIVLNHTDRLLNIQFAVLDYFPGKGKKYAYRLEGFDKDNQWHLTHNHYVEYISLPSGKYTFRVKGSNSHGLWSTSESSIVINILPPFWKTGWFKTLLTIMVILMLGIIYYIRVRAIKTRQIELEGQVRSRTKELSEKTDYLQKAYQEIMQQREQIEQFASKEKEVNEMKLRFFTNVSHEFRTPLTLILAPVQQMLASEDLPGHVKNKFQLIKNNAGRLLRLVSEIIDLRKIDAGNQSLALTRLNLPDYIKNITENFTVLAEDKNISYRIKQNIKARIHGWIDIEKCDKILLNLLSNAFKYTPRNGVITFESYFSSDLHDGIQLPHNLKEQIKHNIQHKQLIVIISNTGKGIPADNLENIFERFYNAHENTQYSSGIGLSLTKSLIDLHGGGIVAESQPGLTRFVLVLVADKKAFPDAKIIDTEKSEKKSVEHYLVATMDTPVPEKKQGKKKDHSLLIVEDNVELQNFLKSSLSTDYQVYTTTNGIKGLETARKVLPDMVISDIMMPEMDGLTLCQKLKHDIHTSHIPIILLTARSSVENQLKGLKTGAEDYISKPFHFEVLKSKINNLIKLQQTLRSKIRGEIDNNFQGFPVTEKDKEFLEKTVYFIEQNMLNNSMNVDEFASYIGMSRAGLYKKVKALTGLPVNEYIITSRLKAAARLIKEGETSVAHAAYKTGFETPEHFSKRFKNEFGITPSKYIQKYHHKESNA